MDYSITTLGSGTPHIGLVVCMHGDEVVGQMVVEKLKQLSSEQIKGSLSLVIANIPALEANKRFIEADLNRSFPGNTSGLLEERLARQLLPVLDQFDFVIDIHTTNSDIDALAIVTDLNEEHKNLLKNVPIEKVAVITPETFSGSLIGECKSAVSIEFGPDKTGANFDVVYKTVIDILNNLGVLTGDTNYVTNRQVFDVFCQYVIDKDFQAEPTLKEFVKIEEGQVIGSIDDQDVLADYSFHPLFLGKGKYSGTLSLAANKRDIQL